MIVFGICVFQLQAKADAVAEPILAEVATPAFAREGPVGKDRRADDTTLLAPDTAPPAPNKDSREAAGEAPMLEDNTVAAASRSVAGEV